MVSDYLCWLMLTCNGKYYVWLEVITCEDKLCFLMIIGGD